MLCERLRSLRLARGLSQVQLAEKVGISNNLYNKYEKKDVRPPYETLVKIADALGVSVSVLLDEIAAYPSEPIINMPIVGPVRAGMDGNIVSDDTGDTRRIAAAGRPDEYFLLRVRGDSKRPPLFEGVLPFFGIKKAPSVGRVSTFGRG